MKYAESFLASSLILVSSLAGAGAAHAGGVAAGTLIENTAQASYDGGAGTQTVFSNTVSLKVDELIDVTVASLNAGPVAANSGTAVLTFSITNTGNGPEAYTLTANPTVTGNDFETVIDSLAVDTNGNGIYDLGVDQVLPSPAQTAAIGADQALTVFVITTVPATAATAQQSQVDLRAQAVTGTGAPGTTFAGAGENGGDAVIGLGGADDNAQSSIGVSTVAAETVNLTKSATVVDPFGGTTVVPGSVVSYQISANVTGTGTVADLIISDPIPTGTTYSASSLALDSTALTDGADADGGTASNTAGISVNLGTVAGGTTHLITFDVTVN